MLSKERLAATLNPLDALRKEMYTRSKRMPNRRLWSRLHLDMPLLCLLLILMAVGLMILYSAGNQELVFISRQMTRMGLALCVMFVLAQVPPARLMHWAPTIYALGVSLLVMVLLIGHIDKGARRWLELGLFRFQPSEIMKLALPMVLASFLNHRQLPPKGRALIIISIMILIPVVLTAKQPDLGTAILIGSAGAGVLLLAGVSWRLVLGLLIFAAFCAPFAWHFMHHYQRERLLIFLDPERDPLGAGYHIIQSKIAIGSGAIFGKGWLNGTQSHLHFLPEHATDFIFAVCGEEFGLLGGLFVLLIYLAIVGRGLYIALLAQNTFCRLLAGGLTVAFFVAVFVNIGMVTGILPVVGLPLPLISYGGTYMVTQVASFGILMSIHSHRKLVSN